MALITFMYADENDPNGYAYPVNIITKPQRAKLTQLGGHKHALEFPYGPQGISYDGMGLEYTPIERPGLAPLLQATSKKQKSVSVTAVLANPLNGGKSSVETKLNILKRIAEEDTDCSFTYGVITLPYRVRLTDFSYVSIQRGLDGNISQAEITLTLEENIIFSQSIVALKAIAYEPDPAPDSSKKTTKTSSSTPTATAPTSTVDDDISFTPTEIHGSP